MIASYRPRHGLLAAAAALTLVAAPAAIAQDNYGSGQYSGQYDTHDYRRAQAGQPPRGDSGALRGGSNTYGGESYGNRSGGYGSEGAGYGSRGETYAPRNDAYPTRGDSYAPRNDSYAPRHDSYQSRNDAYSPGGGDAYSPHGGGGGYSDPGQAYGGGGGDAYGAPYAPPGEQAYQEAAPYDDRKTYNQNEIVAAGHGFFGAISQNLAKAVEYTFKSQGRPNGYILGEDAGGAFVLGLRYGEGRLYTKDAGDHKVFWQGPSLGYDAGAEGSKAMVLVYNLRDPSEIYERFGGVQGAAYLVGGVSVQFQKHENVTLAIIRSGVGLRLGANVGYLKYTRAPTWNPL